MIAKWGLIVEGNHGFGRDNKVWAPHVRAGDARAARQRPGVPARHPASPRRRRLYAHRDGFLLVVEGATKTFHCRFTVAELIDDTAGPSRPA